MKCIPRFTSVYYVPVLRGYNRHAHHLEWHVQRFERRGCSTSAAYGNSSCGLAPEGSSVRIERPLDNGKHRTVRLAPIHRGSYDKCIGRVHLCRDAVADIIIKHAGPRLVFARVAGDASTDGFVADPNDFTLYAEFFQLLCNLSQSNGRISLLARAAVDN